MGKTVTKSFKKLSSEEKAKVTKFDGSLQKGSSYRKLMVLLEEDEKNTEKKKSDDK